MTTFLIYIIRWGIALTVLYSLYGIFLRKETFHALNRFVLLGILVGSMVLPFCRFHTNNSLGSAMQQVEQNISEAAQTSLNEEGIAAAFNPSENASQMAAGPIADQTPVPVVEQKTEAPSLWFILVVAVYFLGLLVCWLRYGRSCISLWRLISRGKRVDDVVLPQGVSLILSDRAHVPCSWMKWIIMNRKDLEANGCMIIQHESAHIRQGHSWDILLCDLTVNMLWFVPFARMLRTDLSDVHEYLADRAVIQSDVNIDQYHTLLISKVSAPRVEMANSLNASSVKRRLLMMFSKESSLLSRFKVLYVLPLVAFLLMGFARPDIVEEVQQAMQEEEVKVHEMITEVVPTQTTERQAEVAREAEAGQMTEAAEPVTDDLPEILPLVQPKDTTGSSQPVHTMTPQGPVAADGLPVLFDLPANTYSEISYGGAYFEFRDRETLLHFVYTCESDDEKIFLGSDDTYLMNRNTKVRYKCRGAVISRTFGSDFHIVGMKGKTVDLTLIFPPMPNNQDDREFIGIAIGIPQYRGTDYISIAYDEKGTIRRCY